LLPLEKPHPGRSFDLTAGFPPAVTLPGLAGFPLAGLSKTVFPHPGHQRWTDTESRRLEGILQAIPAP
jgi:hypothetical protein